MELCRRNHASWREAASSVATLTRRLVTLRALPASCLASIYRAPATSVLPGKLLKHPQTRMVA